MLVGMADLRKLFALLATLSLLSLEVAQGQPAAKLKLPEIKYEKYTLPNGLTVLTHEDHRLPLVAVDLWYHVGPLNERPGRTGFAHLFEHMMFEGSEHVGEKAHFKYVEAAGASDINGTTDFDRTNYFETLPANQLELGLWLESDRMGFLMEGLDRVKLANQRDVVRNERRQGEGRPYSVANEEIYHQLFAPTHPYYGNVIGSHADIEAVRVADVREFHQQFYTPNNASIAIAGDFDPKSLKELLTKYFGPIPAGPKVEPVNTPTPPITSQRRATVTDTVKLPQMRVAWLTPPAFTPTAYDANVAMYALGGAKASRLDQALVYKTQVAQSVQCFVRDLKLTSIAQCTITAKPGVKLEDLEATMWAEIAKLQADGPTAEEVEASKATALSQKITGLQRLGGFGGVADSLDEYNQYTGDPGYLAKDVAATEAVTAASAKSAAKLFAKESAVVVYCVPGAKLRNDVPRSPDDTDAKVAITNPYTPEFEAAQSWRKTPPTVGPPVTVHLPVPQTFTLANGLQVYFVEEKALPVLSASLVSRAGSENNPPTKAGLASLTALTMAEATTTRDLTQLAEAQERLGTTIRMRSSMDGATAAMTVLTNHTGEGMTLFADVIEHPALNNEDFDRLRKQRLVAISQEGDQVSAIAQRVGPKLLYGEQPYGASPNGTAASVESITREDVASFYGQHFGPSDSALVLVGDIGLADAKKLAETYFGGWSAKAVSAATIPPAPQAPPTHIVIVDKPGAPQTALVAYGLGTSANSPDTFILEIMNYILGGSFGSRINMNLREVHGYTYGAGSYYAQYRTGGPFITSTLVRTDVTGAAAKEMMAEIRGFSSKLPTAAELNTAKNSNVQSLPGNFETTGATADALGSLFLYNRPPDYFATLPAKYAAVTPADIERVAKQDLRPDELLIVAAGDRAKIEPQLKTAGLGPVEVRDLQGNVVTKIEPAAK